MLTSPTNWTSSAFFRSGSDEILSRIFSSISLNLCRSALGAVFGLYMFPIIMNLFFEVFNFINYDSKMCGSKIERSLIGSYSKFLSTQSPTPPPAFGFIPEESLIL